MGFYTDHVLPRVIHLVLGNPDFAALRREYLGAVEGTVLEIGFGSGLSLPFYSPAVLRLYAVEPSDVAWEMAGTAVEGVRFPVERIGLSAEAIPLPDLAVDAVISAWTLCSIPDAARALREIRRVLKPGGVFRFVEHGLSPEPGVARWQRRLTPLQKRIAGGCHLDRPIDRLITDAGFQLERIDCFYARGPKIGTYLYAGAARLSAALTTQ